MCWAFNALCLDPETILCLSPCVFYLLSPPFGWLKLFINASIYSKMKRWWARIPEAASAGPSWRISEEFLLDIDTQTRTYRLVKDRPWRSGRGRREEGGERESSHWSPLCGSDLDFKVSSELTTWCLRFGVNRDMVDGTFMMFPTLWH